MQLKSLFITLLFLFLTVQAQAQSPATILEFDSTFLTYPFSDPNPIPRTGKIYPYFTYDGYSAEAQPQVWKIVELENDYIRVQITPEIGGKIWSAWDKIRDVPFIYSNDVVKFRNIAMRGPWTSGGIEFNFGIIGHTPTVSTPVDYVTIENDDGSVSCYISALDLLTRTRWIVEIRLPADQAWFSTEVYWVNPTDLDQPYYTWMNLAVEARDDLHFIDPGTHYIGHDGRDHLWPVDTTRNTDLSIYQNNAFGGSKSYHITGKHSDFFGTYYENSDDGMIHLADRDDKPGKKVFLWALSGAGEIWETLLTDHAGQYVEVQSGRLFNQNSPSSSRTPFKQIGFAPQQTDRWIEYWFPYHGIGKPDYVDKKGVWHFTTDQGQLGIDIMSLTPVTDTLKVWVGEELIGLQSVELKPLEPTYLAIMVNPDRVTKITLGETLIIPEWIQSQELSRPLAIPENFDEEGAYNQYMLGHDFARFRQYETAEKYIRSSLVQDSFFIPALNEMAMLQYRKMQYDSAFYFARRALSINTYDQMANYYYGMAADQIGQMADAFDGWEIAALSPTWRIPAWYQIAAARFWDEDWSKCQIYLNKIFNLQPSHPAAIKIQLALDRVRGRAFDKSLAARLTDSDPNNHYVLLEKYLHSGSNEDKMRFQSSIKNELPAQTYLEMAIWYKTKLNRWEDALRILEMAPLHNLIEYWKAFLAGSEDESHRLLITTDQGSAEFVFPFRRESVPMLKWAIDHTDDWKPRYYLALIQSHTGNPLQAKEILDEFPDDIHFAPLYAWRSGFQEDPVRKEKDLRIALALDPESWRHVLNLSDFLMKNERLDEAQALLEPYYMDQKSNYQVGMALSRLYLMSKKPDEADEILSEIVVLPYEGAYEGRIMYQAVKLNRALNALEAGKLADARKYLGESKLWPENLGVGKPYDSQIDTQWVDLIDSWIVSRGNGKETPKEEIQELRDKIMERFFEFEEEAPF